MERLTKHELMLVKGAVSTQLRSAQRALDNAKEPDACDRWANMCVELKRIMDKLNG